LFPDSRIKFEVHVQKASQFIPENRMYMPSIEVVLRPEQPHEFPISPVSGFAQAFPLLLLSMWPKPMIAVNGRNFQTIKQAGVIVTIPFETPNGVTISFCL
jgi:hypothetical protein